MKLKTFMAVALLVLGTIIPFTIEAKNIEIFVNGEEIFMDVVPIIENGVTFVPVSFVTKELGGIVTWESPKVILQTSRGWIECKVGSNKATKNGEEIELVAAPKLINGRVFVPLRFVSDVLGAKTEYSNGTKVIHITKLKNYRVEGFHDPLSNKCLCIVWPESAGERIAILVHDEATDTWMKFDENYEPILGIQKNRLQRGYQSKLDFPKENEDYGSIDLKNNLWIRDFEYNLSDDEAYGVTSRIQYRVLEGMPEKYEGIFVKSFVTGEVREIARTYIGAKASWVNELSLQIPVEDTKFDYLIYDVKTGESQYIRDEESSKYRPQAYRYIESVSHDLPEELDIEKLPTFVLTETQKMEASLKIENKTYKVPFVFEKEQDTYVPLKYIIEAVGGMVEQDSMYIYGDQAIELTNSNSARYNQQFYISKDALKQIGIELEVKYLIEDEQ